MVGVGLGEFDLELGRGGLARLLRERRRRHAGKHCHRKGETIHDWTPVEMCRERCDPPLVRSLNGLGCRDRRWWSWGGLLPQCDGVAGRRSVLEAILPMPMQGMR